MTARSGLDPSTPADRPERTDAALLAALDDPREQAAAWAELVTRHTPRLYAVARSFALDAGAAEDLVQVAWLRLLERAHQLRDHGALGPWLCTIVRNEARKLVTRRRTVPMADGFEHRPDPSAPPEAGLVTAERAAALRLAFARLGEDCRQLLLLLTAEPRLSYDEIAAALGRPRGSLGPTRQRCLDQLRRHLPAGFEP
jgi:RNA polymerase sigma factor (sigma-70 family)